ncbi:MAG: hypothetical protein HYU33_00095 [Candidatus Omnitrophica bacterium]|nr:hypothetical protein [Candidatus Omnitrophota bacterium]
MYNVGAGIKQKTLELRPEDVCLAEWIQLRKSQLMNENYITFKDRYELLKLANLEGIKHIGMANRRLLNKLGRLKEKGIILSHPKHISFLITNKHS